MLRLFCFSKLFLGCLSYSGNSTFFAVVRVIRVFRAIGLTRVTRIVRVIIVIRFIRFIWVIRVVKVIRFVRVIWGILFVATYTIAEHTRVVADVTVGARNRMVRAGIRQ